MGYYTAKEVSEILQLEGDQEMSLRKVRYYSQINLLSPLETVNGKGKFTEKHLEELRAIRTLQKTGERLDDIKGKIQGLELVKLSNISNQRGYLTADRLLESRTVQAHPDVSITLSNNISMDEEKEMVRAILRIIEGQQQGQ